jgi:hypothetical protein
MTETEGLEVLRITKLADTNTERVRRFDPETGDPYLANPETWSREDHTTWIHEPYPFAGLRLDNKPVRTRISTNFAAKGVAEGWLVMDGIEMVHRPGGPSHNPWQQTHTFTQAKTLTFKTVDGDVVYRVVHQPDKYACAEKAALLGIDAEHDNETKVTDDIYNSGETRVDFFYGLELVNS